MVNLELNCHLNRWLFLLLNVKYCDTIKMSKILIFDNKKGRRQLMLVVIKNCQKLNLNSMSSKSTFFYNVLKIENI